MGTGNEELDRAIEIAGYAYDSVQDIFYSTLDPWQRNVGYCRLYDEVAAPLGMIIDSEPIFFEYQGKKWKIGLWKGQYDLVTGCEVGVYVSAFEINIPGVFKGTMYKAIDDSNLLQISYTLRKNGEVLLTRSGRHWWLTGFKLGEFSEPSELVMDVSITLKDQIMRDAFISGLRKIGYSEETLNVFANTVIFRFDTPHSPQPITRNERTDRLIQRKNQLLCEKYQEITGPYTSIPEKIKAIEEEAPEIYNLIFKMGKNKKLFEMLIMTVLSGTVLLTFILAKKEHDKESIKLN